MVPKEPDPAVEVATEAQVKEGPQMFPGALLLFLVEWLHRLYLFDERFWNIVQGQIG